MKTCFILFAVYVVQQATNKAVICMHFSPTVELPQGKIRGSIEQWKGQSTYEYKGVPFASPPVQSLRYSGPVEPKSWEGVKDTISYGKPCPQNLWAIKMEDTAEDCLYLNVFVKKETFDSRSVQLKPVLFWVHGGAFQAGSANDHDAYRGIPLVIVEDVILVTINYRLGVLGFLPGNDSILSVTPNLGLWDQFFALKWTRDNIHLFGGDPNQITIFGQSAGSASIAYHLLSPISKGFFKGAIMESGGPLRFMAKEKIPEVLNEILNSTNCTDSKDKLDCLRSVPWTELLDITSSFWFSPIFGDKFLPLEVTVAIPTRQYNDVNLLIGAERDEGDLLICGTYQFAVLKASNSTTSTYGYIHTQPPMKDFNNIPALCGRKADKVCHCDELVYVFGAPLRDTEDYDTDDFELSVNIMKIWADFARTGKPTKQGTTDWPQIGNSEKVILVELNNKHIGKLDSTTGTKCFNKV